MHMAVCPGKVLATRLHTARGQGTKTRGGVEAFVRTWISSTFDDMAERMLQLPKMVAEDGRTVGRSVEEFSNPPRPFVRKVKGAKCVMKRKDVSEG